MLASLAVADADKSPNVPLSMRAADGACQGQSALSGNTVRKLRG